MHTHAKPDTLLLSLDSEQAMLIVVALERFHRTAERLARNPLCGGWQLDAEAANALLCTIDHEAREQCGWKL